jgi:hypothetical protein
MKYYLKLTSGEGWDEVDEFTFKNWDKAILEDGNKRYSGNWITEEAGVISLDCCQLTKKDLGQICRILDIEAEKGSTPNGWCHEPGYVKFHIRGGLVLRDIKQGINYKPQAA